MAVVGLCAGFIANILVGIKGGLVGMLIAGLAGGVVGGFLFEQLKIRMTGNAIVDSIAQSAVGAVIVVIVARLFI